MNSRHPKPSAPEPTPTTDYSRIRVRALRDQLRPTITIDEFAADLAAAADQDPEDYAAYGVTPDEILQLGQDFTTWAQRLTMELP